METMALHGIHREGEFSAKGEWARSGQRGDAPDAIDDAWPPVGKGQNKHGRLHARRGHDCVWRRCCEMIYDTPF